jgi:hypothetical protein
MIEKMLFEKIQKMNFFFKFRIVFVATVFHYRTSAVVIYARRPMAFWLISYSLALLATLISYQEQILLVISGKSAN